MNAQSTEGLDALVIGGGVAGSTAAAALQARGLSVLVCEAGLPSEKRLAGELMHPPAAEDLDRLGLLKPLISAGAAPVYGFVIFRGPEDKGTMLSYSEVRGGRSSSIAIEHAVLTRTLLDEVGQRPGVEVWDGARVTNVETRPGHPRVTVKMKGEEHVFEVPLVVSADGRASSSRDDAGIEIDRGDAFRMVGWLVPGGRLPHPGFGHVFSGGATTTLAYQISKDVVRVMFELGMDDAIDVREQLAQIPLPLRSDIVRAMKTQPRQTSKVWALSPRRVTAGRVAVVGDAGGCVHPLTATGIAFCTGDAHRLADAIGHDFDRGDGIPDALAGYERSRRGPMAARAIIGPALVEALASPDPAMRLLRHGLFRYWERSPRGRRTSIALLSTQEPRAHVMVREYAAVCAHALTGVGKEVAPSEVLPAIAGLARRSGAEVTRLLTAR